MTCHYCYSHYCNLTHYHQVAGGAGGWLSAALHELYGWSVNAGHGGGSNGR